MTIEGPDYCSTVETRSAAGKQDFQFKIEDPKLWWPNGFGEQFLYNVKFRISIEGEVQIKIDKKIGLRRVELEREPENGGESFRFRINNVKVFCKGANWIPADSFLPRITKDKYRTLLTLARDANINMLRVWGGGIYEQPIFYDLCDELGLMVWQDFMFAYGHILNMNILWANVNRKSGLFIASFIFTRVSYCGVVIMKTNGYGVRNPGAQWGKCLEKNYSARLFQISFFLSAPQILIGRARPLAVRIPIAKALAINTNGICGVDGIHRPL